MTQRTDVVIIGGGAIGCSIAYQLRKRSVDAIVVDQGEIGEGASSAATGLLAPIRPFLRSDNPYMKLQLAGLRLFSSLVPELEADSGIVTEYTPTGTLRIVHLPQEQRVHKWISEWQQAGFPIELLIEDLLHQREPLLALDIVGAIYNPQEPQINAQKLVKAYATAALHLGAQLLAHTSATGILRQGNKVTGVRTTYEDIHCKYLVVAAGAWSTLCSDWLSIVIPVRPLRGQSLSLLSVSPLHHILFSEQVYLAPRVDGTIIVGTTQEDVGFDSSVTSEGIAFLLDAASKVAPSLAKSTVKNVWAGLRPRTPDTRPIIGTVPQWENVILASGHGGFGILLSIVTGQAVADLVVTGQLPSII